MITYNMIYQPPYDVHDTGIQNILYTNVYSDVLNNILSHLW